MSLRFFTTIIIKKPINLCVNCVYYMKYKYTDPFDEIYSNNENKNLL